MTATARQPHAPANMPASSAPAAVSSINVGAIVRDLASHCGHSHTISLAPTASDDRVIVSARSKYTQVSARPVKIATAHPRPRLA
jgi:hypothetical protein